MKTILALLLLWPTLAYAAPSMLTSQWTFRYSVGMPLHPAQGTPGWAFNFPRYTGPIPTCRSCAQVDMVTAPVAGVHGRSITITGSIVHTGVVVYNYRTEASNTCISPHAMAHAYIEVAIDNSDYHRFWSTPLHIPLQAGPFVVTIPLNANHWTSVFGHRSARGLGSAMAGAHRVGLTFGGGCFFGHGVNIRSGKSTFRITSYRINL